MGKATASAHGFTGRHALYRFFDVDALLLYIGKTCNLNQRFDQHARKQPWWSDVAGCKVEFYPDDETLAAAERTAILAEHPKHNIVHNGVVVAQEDEDDWREPWLAISPRLTAGADRLHEECRQHRAANYPEVGYQMTAPCGACLSRAAEVLMAADTAVGHDDESIGLALAANLHLRWLRSAQGEWEPAVGPPLRSCECRDCRPPAAA